MTTEITETKQLTEAPYSWNTRAISPEGFDEQFTLRDTDAKTFVQRVEGLKKYLVERKYTPTRGAAQNASATTANASDDAPLCAIHHEPMAKRTGKNGQSFWSCPKKLDDGSWCPYRPK